VRVRLATRRAQIVFVYVCTQNEFTFLFELFLMMSAAAAAPHSVSGARTKNALQPAFLLLNMRCVPKVHGMKF
jgi:hypothetical protein